MSYECLDCDRIFASAPAVQSHARAKGHSLPECEDCDRIFINKDALTNHLKYSSLHGYCEDCNRFFSTQSAYEQHVADSPLHRPRHCCEDCGRQFASDNAYEQHLADSPRHQYSSSDDSYEEYESSSEESDGSVDEAFCASCSRLFIDTSALNQHLAFNQSHNWCFVCSRDFSSAQALAQHNASSAHRNRTLNCPFCKNTFKSPSAIAMHIESGCHKINRHQVTAAVHKLNIIPQISVDRRIGGTAKPPTHLVTLSANERAFNGSKYECYLCHSTFTSLDRLNQHLNSPTHDELEFRCPHCRSEFQLISGLVQHIESESCGIARFKQVVDHFENLTRSFSRLLTI
ncbi:hypothetical protein AGABI2DRAFT_115875 [Agaricus bisporus var. bisporus H97]|uniref:hypothetical protein n=1 Tax=Agaricus bisporus var. bisporus (strain H97 / ATCC MYA-4626 / FGSC 10389) TaxID=936046 RepID=UPI00029F50E5|nr:hypothetical protein AGABI2DRAFT_115875 [Agaricus bisporus var. bisporus H97]EKV48821.1 hypothetical protein AGABI2DRAFT_115875 [Agaricus bisporus var. bisporus H97]